MSPPRQASDLHELLAVLARPTGEAAVERCGVLLVEAFRAAPALLYEVFVLLPTLTAWPQRLALARAAGGPLPDLCAFPAERLLALLAVDPDARVRAGAEASSSLVLSRKAIAP